MNKPPEPHDRQAMGELVKVYRIHVQYSRADWFYTIWVTWGLNLPSQLVFTDQKTLKV